MNILVTGASRGIGKVIAQELLSVGDVYVTGRDENALQLCNSKGYCVCDLSRDIEVLAKFIEENNIDNAVSEGNRNTISISERTHFKPFGFDVLVNNAGDYIYGAVEEVEKTDLERLFATNLMAPTYLISKAVPYMKKNKWGRIVNIGSISGVMGEAYASAYSASKAGLIGLTKSLALELAQHEITVNTINPGWVDTELSQKSIEESEFTKEETLEGIPQRRFVDPIEVAKLVKYLISDDARGITGQSINLCAGLSVGI